MSPFPVTTLLKARCRGFSRGCLDLVKSLDSVSLNFESQLRSSSGEPRLADECLFAASVPLYPDRRDVAENAAILVCMADLNNLDINCQTLDFRDRCFHGKSLLLFDFIEKFIAETGILENPCDGNNVAYGVVSVNGFGRILMRLKRDR